MYRFSKAGLNPSDSPVYALMLTKKELGDKKIIQFLSRRGSELSEYIQIFNPALDRAARSSIASGQITPEYIVFHVDSAKFTDHDLSELVVERGFTDDLIPLPVDWLPPTTSLEGFVTTTDAKLFLSLVVDRNRETIAELADQMSKAHHEHILGEYTIAGRFRRK